MQERIEQPQLGSLYSAATAFVRGQRKPVATEKIIKQLVDRLTSVRAGCAELHAAIHIMLREAQSSDWNVEDNWLHVRNLLHELRDVLRARRHCKHGPELVYLLSQHSDLSVLPGELVVLHVEVSERLLQHIPQAPPYVSILTPLPNEYAAAAGLQVVFPALPISRICLDYHSASWSHVPRDRDT
eukprot:CAMPEP_0171209540 /NCGR_PEP_ID=MMETSP0790-20130122/28647_1 /TAXON_ID=2925 /ORGANISM="Alexandrium catenella, Strain OF101" /LENGTH=184 /DNA_ID=CAMNT_0011675151 /DNA_START=313 /DNA_END=867 /DNA_ORIENTATION=+